MAKDNRKRIQFNLSGGIKKKFYEDMARNEMKAAELARDIITDYYKNKMKAQESGSANPFKSKYDR